MDLDALTRPYYPTRHPDQFEKSREDRIKRDSLLLGRNPFRIFHIKPEGHRSRFELLFLNGKLGVKTGFDENSKFIEIRHAETPTPQIQSMIEVIYANPLPINRASLRFRSSSIGKKGLWIDAANIDIKTLLDERNWLLARLEDGWIIEMGQKGKQLGFKDAEKLGLVDPTPHPWLDSYARNKNVALDSTIATFSQCGPEVNRALIQAGLELLEEYQANWKSSVEWGAGYGNLTVPFAPDLSTEPFLSSFELLKLNQARFFPNVRVEKWSVERGLKSFSDDSTAGQLWILDPPKSGFGNLFELMKPGHGPDGLLIYHCHEKGLQKDFTLLKGLGYTLLDWACVDAFPGTDQHEVVSLFSKA